jgi:hypothetical protein
MLDLFLLCAPERRHQRGREVGVDPQKFEGMVRKLSATLSRRSLVGGSVGAAVLAAVGLGDEALARKEQVNSEACTPENRLCGCKNKKNKKGDRKPKPWQKCRPCSTCCHKYSVEVSKKKRRCACKPHETECGNSTQCCSGVCGNGICQIGQCAELGQTCNERVSGGTRCCEFAGGVEGRCNQTSTAGGTCVQCLANGATCDPASNLCCDFNCSPVTNTCGGPFCLGLDELCDPLAPQCCLGLACQGATGEETCQLFPPPCIGQSCAADPTDPAICCPGTTCQGATGEETCQPPPP